VIGGVAVTLHGHVRATSDVDVYVPAPLAAFAERLRADGFSFDAGRREFSLDGVPVHRAPPAQAVPVPTHMRTIDDVRTVSLADLINLKLRSGLRDLARARDLADVVDLIRANGSPSRRETISDASPEPSVPSGTGRRRPTRSATPVNTNGPERRPGVR
jgi:hypothetical protein